MLSTLQSIYRYHTIYNIIVHQIVNIQIVYINKLFMVANAILLALLLILIKVVAIFNLFVIRLILILLCLAIIILVGWFRRKWLREGKIGWSWFGMIRLWSHRNCFVNRLWLRFWLKLWRKISIFVKLKTIKWCLKSIRKIGIYTH